MKTDNTSPTILDLQQITAASRRKIAYRYADLQSSLEDLDVATPLRYAIQRNPWTWLSGAFFTGCMITFFKNNTPAKEKRAPAGILDKADSYPPSCSYRSTAIKNQLFQTCRFLFPLLKPFIVAYATRKISDLSERCEKNKS